ncbi:MAG: sensor histidine kinase [Verrucomicrobia bacterium]|nr:sensor histidine kinase [Verrucomicrobiota bacterium]
MQPNWKVAATSKIVLACGGTVAHRAMLHAGNWLAGRRALQSCVVPGLTAIFLLGVSFAAPATILWSDAGARVIHKTPEGIDILGGAVKRDDTANDALYFKFRIDPLSDAAAEEYYALFQLFVGNEYRLAVGNAPDAWGYSACFASETGPSNRLAGEYDLKSSEPEAAGLGLFKPYELPRHDLKRTILFKVQYVPGGDDLITVWLSPRLSRGATDENQPESLTTKFKADAAFDQIRLRHGGGGNGWIFSDMAIATSFNDFIVHRFWETWWFNGGLVLGLLVAVGGAGRFFEKRKVQRQLLQLEQERTVERERARIAQDLHDDLGSSLTRISLLSDLVKSDRNYPAQVETHAIKLAQSAAQTVRALEEIVWAVRPGSDSLQSLVEYIAHFANELFENDPVRCRLDLPPDLPARPLPPDVRHNIFLIVKEALTNALRHAGAKEVRVSAKVSGSTLEIVVADDGRGFAANGPKSPAKGNGLGNMRRRAGNIGAALTVETALGQGTAVRLLTILPGRAGV